MSPPRIQNIAVSLKGWQVKRKRYSGGYDTIADAVFERDNWSHEELESFQRNRLQNFLQVAARSNYWREQFDRHGVSPTSDTPFNELKKLPIISKEDVKSTTKQIKPDRLEKSAEEHQTSGTTGSGLVFERTTDAVREQWAVWWRYRNWHGITQDMWHGHFGSFPIISENIDSPPYWRMNYPSKEVWFSTFHLKESTASDYAQAIQEKNLPWLHGYPSAISVLASHILEADIGPVEPVEVVTTGAGNLLDHQRTAIERAFNATVREHYGLAEAVANISECPHDNLHIDEDFAYVELVPIDSSPNRYRIIGTNWTNPAFPLFRYDTGDVAIGSDNSCDCGKPGRVIEAIEGRSDDHIVLPSGAHVWGMNQIPKKFESIREMQIYQPDPELVIFRIVPRDSYSNGTETDLIEEARKRLGKEITIDVVYVDEIEKTDSGKLQFVVSDIEEGQVQTPSV